MKTKKLKMTGKEIKKAFSSEEFWKRICERAKEMQKEILKENNIKI